MDDPRNELSTDEWEILFTMHASDSARFSRAVSMGMGGSEQLVGDSGDSFEARTKNVDRLLGAGSLENVGTEIRLAEVGRRQAHAARPEAES